MATGAWSPTLVDLEGQCVSKVRLVPLFCEAPMSGVLMEYDIVLGVRTSETYRCGVGMAQIGSSGVQRRTGTLHLVFSLAPA